jgi:hypothetical protein
MAPAEEIEQAASATRRPDLSAATAPGERVLELGLPAAVSASAQEGLALLLKLRELTARILEAVVHLEAFRAPDEASAEDEEALEAARVIHGRASALKYAVSLGDLLVDPGQLLAVRTAALGGGQLLLKLHAADLLLAHALRQDETIAAHDRDAGKSERGEARAYGRPHRRRHHATNTAMHAHDWFRSPRMPPERIMRA